MASVLFGANTTTSSSYYTNTMTGAFTASASVLMTSIQFYDGSGNGGFQAALYGTGATNLASGSATSTGVGLTTVPLSSPVLLTPGVVYAVGIYGVSGSGTFAWGPAPSPYVVSGVTFTMQSTFNGVTNPGGNLFYVAGASKPTTVFNIGVGNSLNVGFNFSLLTSPGRRGYQEPLKGRRGRGVFTSFYRRTSGLIAPRPGLAGRGVLTSF